MSDSNLNVVKNMQKVRARFRAYHDAKLTCKNVSILLSIVVGLEVG